MRIFFGDNQLQCFKCNFRSFQCFSSQFLYLSFFLFLARSNVTVKYRIVYLCVVSRVKHKPTNNDCFTLLHEHAHTFSFVSESLFGSVFTQLPFVSLWNSLKYTNLAQTFWMPKKVIFFFSFS